MIILRQEFIAAICSGLYIRADMIVSRTFEISAPPAGCSVKISEFFNYWRSIHPDRSGIALPGRQHFDPMDIPGLLPNIWLLNVFHNPPRFHVRLAGTVITEYSGRDATGRWCHDTYNNFEETGGYRCITACARDGRPQFRVGSVIANPGRTHMTAERLYLPLASNGRDVDVMANMTQYL